MAARRVLGLLTAFLMLHLTLVGADWRCAEHGDQNVAGPAAVSSQHASMVAGNSESAATDQPCQTPAQPECCRAMTSCAVNAALRADADVRQVPPTRSVIESALVRTPLSPTASPDPPPPKA
jgi:hypothetical protein